MLNENKYKEFLEQLKIAKPRYTKEETENKKVYLEYSERSTISDAVLDTFGLSKHVLAKEYDWDTNIMAHYDESDNSIFIDQWFYEPGTGHKQSGVVDKFIPDNELKNKLTIILQNKEVEARDRLAQKYEEFITEQIKYNYNGPEDTKEGLLMATPEYSRRIAEIQLTGNLAGISLEEKKGIATDINEFARVCKEGGINVINVHDAKCLYRKRIEEIAQEHVNKADEDEVQKMPTLREVQQIMECGNEDIEKRMHDALKQFTDGEITQDEYVKEYTSIKAAQENNKQQGSLKGIMSSEQNIQFTKAQAKEMFSEPSINEQVEENKMDVRTTMALT